jgi:hypothetical protein
VKIHRLLLGCLVVGVGWMVGCNPDDDPRAARSMVGPSAGVGVSHETARGGIGGSGGSGGAGAAPACPAEDIAPGDNACPFPCTSCNSNVCVIDCDQSPGLCANEIIDCPDAYRCQVLCGLGASCLGTTVRCNASYRCSLLCGGDLSCGQAQVSCGNGPCDLYCSGVDSCDAASIDCGAQACTADCGGTISMPITVCGPSCECTTCN